MYRAAIQAFFFFLRSFNLLQFYFVFGNSTNHCQLVFFIMVIMIINIINVLLLYFF